MAKPAYVVLATLLACGGSGVPGSKPARVAATQVELGASIRIVGELEALAFGMSIAEARAKVPGLAGPSVAPAPLGAPKVDTLSLHAKNARYRAAFVDDRLTSVEMELDGLTPDDVWKAWGTPFDTGKQLVVVDRERRMRAVVEPPATGAMYLKVEPIVPLAALIDSDPEKVAGVRVIGRPVVGVMRELEPRTLAKTGSDTYALMPTEYAYGGHTSLTLFASETGVVEAWTLDGILFEPSDAAWEAVFATYANAWGHDFGPAGEHLVFDLAPRVFVGEHLLFDRTPRVMVSQLTGSATVFTRVIEGR